MMLMFSCSKGVLFGQMSLNKSTLLVTPFYWKPFQWMNPTAPLASPLQSWPKDAIGQPAAVVCPDKLPPSPSRRMFVLKPFSVVSTVADGLMLDDTCERISDYFGRSWLVRESRQIIHNGTATSTATTPHQVNHSGSRSACRSVQGSRDYYSIASGLIVFDQLIRIQFNLWVYFENMTILKKRIWKQWLDASTWQ